MRSRQKTILKFLFSLFLITGAFLFATTIFAQDFGVNEVGNEIALPTEDPRVVAAKIIRVALGFLGIVAVAIVLYGGFVWMTAGGNEERISTAKKILTNGLIGLIIIIFSFGITQFVLNRLMEVTGITPGAGGPGGPGGPGPGGLPSDSFLVRGIQPNGAIPIRNVVVRVVFNKDVDATTLTDNFTVKKAADGSLVDGTASASGTVVEFIPSANCPAPNDDRKCFDSDTEFTVEAATGLRSTDGKFLICGGLAAACRGNFTTGDLVDTAGPEVRITYPDPGDSVSANAIVSIEAQATDDAGISYLEYFSNGGTLGTDVPAGATPRDYSSIFDWDTNGVTAGSRHTLTTKAFDVDTNNTTSGGVDVIVRAAHCFNGRQDGDETGIDCGGADCGTCDGGSCTSDADCRGGHCTPGGVCRTLPAITAVSPNDGAVGNYVTIYGQGFGRTSGQVYFNNVLAGAPACPASATWRNNQIIAVVPAGATDGPVKVVVPPPTGETAADYTDQTDDERGPVLPNFDVNDTSRPGICSVIPDSGEPRSDVVVAGTQFGTSQGTSEIIFGGTRAERVSLWTNTSIGAIVPLIAPATVPVQVVVGGENSNPINFRVVATADAPRILSFSPTHGPVGEYVTIFGANFGDDDELGQVFFKNALGADLLADVIFPAACGTDWWKNDQIIVKVPTGAATDILKIVTGGIDGGQSDDTSDLTTSDFTVDPGTAGPGICKITPNNGPIDLPVRLDGERFGASALVNFYSASPVSVTPTDGAQISTAVPAGSQTGPVNVTSGGATGNSVNFSVQDCREGAECGAGELCCRDGSCAATCAAAAGKGYYFWQFSTGRLPIYPQVVESCSNPPPPGPASPSPWSGRDGGERVCVNATITARFTTKINSASVNTSNILVESCSDQTCTTKAEVTGSSVLFIDVDDHQDGFELKLLPVGRKWTRNTWYQVTLKSDAAAGTGIKSCLGGVGCPDGGFFLDGDRDGVEGGDYTWRFKTRDSDETCDIGLVGVAPYERTLTSVGATQNYNSLCYAAGDVCITIDCSAYHPWRWFSSDISKATVAGSTTPSEVATARAETEAGLPVRITGEIPSERKSGSGNLTIDFTDPKIINSWPNCSDACSNAEVGAEFNTNMNPTSVTNMANVNLYIWKCGNGVLEVGEDCDDGNANPTDGCSATCFNEGSSARYGSSCGNDRRETGEDCDGVPFPDRCNPATCLNTGSDGAVAVCGNGIVEEGEDCDDGNAVSGDGCSGTDRPPACLNEGTRSLEEISPERLSYNDVNKKLTIVPTPRTLIPRTYFLPNTFYKVVISNAVTSVSGVHLTDLNYPVDGPNSYSWTFKTKDDASPCAVDRVAVSPQNAILNFIGATQNYSSTPFSEPDLCSPSGQRLGAMDYNWGWTSADPGVATITEKNDYPSCGNGVREFGEDCDDGNTAPGDGCDANCLNEGSNASYGSSCGDGVIQTGEDCDDGNVRSGDGCNNICQHEGSAAGGVICGNRAKERGEDCDDGNAAAGDGCGATCLNEGTVTDARIDPYQTAEAIDLAIEDVAAGRNSSTTEISAEERESGESDMGSLTLRCGGQDCRAISPSCVLTSNICAGTTSQYCESDADCELGLGSNTCCYFKPKVKTCDPSSSAAECLSGAVEVCRNARISVTFDQVMETASITGKILVVSDYSGSCPEGTTELAFWTGEEKTSWQFAEKIKQWLPAPIAKILMGPIYKIENGLAFFRQFKDFINQVGEVIFGRKVLAAPGDPWCVWPGTVESVVVGTGDDLKTEASFSPTKAFDGYRIYRVLLLGDNTTTPTVEGIRNAKGVALGGGSSHGEYPAAYRGREIYQWSFTTGANICTLSQVSVYPGAYTFSQSGKTHDFTAVARDSRGYAISRLPEVYYWEWQDWLSNDPSVAEIDPVGVCADTTPIVTCYSDIDCRADGGCQFLGKQTVTAQNKNGDARILVSAKITADTVLSPRTVGQIKNSGADVTVYLCENPWPNRFGVTGEGLTDETYNFKTYYCQDRGGLGFSDDLPEVSDPPIVNNPPEPPGSSDFLLREYFLFLQGNYCTLSKMPCNGSSPCAPDGGSCQSSPDAIGIRIYTNDYHLSLADWYLAQGFRPASPAGKIVDQYQAVEDGRTIYVSAANQPRPPLPVDADLYTNVYLISYNEGAHQDTIDIYNQLVENWKFNINLDNDKVCRPPGGGASARDADGVVISCTADLDCPQTSTTQYSCASPKDKLARDVKRLSDLEKIKAAVERYRVARAYPPKLGAGSYVRGISTSKWDSWAVLGQELGTSLPTDPLNKFLGCPSAYSADTCWSTSEETYVCPGLSHIYQYRYEPGTGVYNIGADLEYRLGPTVNPSWSWFRSFAPTYITYENTCAGVPYSSTGICGDGIIKTTGVCARNSSTSCAADPECVEGGVDQGPCLYEQCEVGDTRIDSSCTPATGGSGQRSQTCDAATCRWPATWTTCLAKCGNGVIDADVGETCDRGPGGGRIPGGGTLETNKYQCSPICQMTGGWCGDGTLQSGFGERCDDGICTLRLTCANPAGCLCTPATSATTTTKSCTVKNSASSCGNGNYGKVCDNNTAISCRADSDCPGSTCRPICATGCVGSAPYCGDTVVDTPEEKCDRNLMTSRGVCAPVEEYLSPDSPMLSYDFDVPCGQDSDCPSGEGESWECLLCPPEAGTGYPRLRTLTCESAGSARQCQWASSGWSACTVSGSCGDGVVEGGEQCDDGNDINTDACTDTCQSSRCGDGFTRAGIEMCDSGAANGTPCSAPYGSTCNYCSRSCTLITASGLTCGDGIVTLPQEQCDSRLPASPANWICVDTSNPWAGPDDLSSPTSPACSPSSCAITCATGRACNNTEGEPDDDGDGIINACDPNDDSNVDGCMDDARDCARVDFNIEGIDDDTFDVYIDNHLVGRAGRVYYREFNYVTREWESMYTAKTVQINTLSRGLHNFRIVFVSGTPRGIYDVNRYYDPSSGAGVDFSVADYILPIEDLGGEIRVDFVVR